MCSLMCYNANCNYAGLKAAESYDMKQNAAYEQTHIPKVWIPMSTNEAYDISTVTIGGTPGNIEPYATVTIGETQPFTEVDAVIYENQQYHEFQASPVLAATN